MERFTQKKTSQERKYVLGEQEIAQKPYGYTGAAVDRLGVFEDVFEDLIAAQERLAAKKLVNSNVLSLLRTYGIQ